MIVGDVVVATWRVSSDRRVTCWDDRVWTASYHDTATGVVVVTRSCVTQAEAEAVLDAMLAAESCEQTRRRVRTTARSPELDAKGVSP